MSIELDQMRFYAYHGVLEQERRVGNEFVVSLSLEVDTLESLKTDELGDTINYAEVYRCVEEEMQSPSKLLEYVAGRIVSALFTRFSRIEAVNLRLTKLNPPFRGDIASATVYLTAVR